ncbi:MAG: zinc ABC transporter permease subunit ZnuB [Gammaproteobacteria bacterium]
MDDFILRAALAGIVVSVVAGPLGSVIVWRRMAYFGDTLAHSSLLGVALGVVLGVSINAMVIAGCVAVALLIVLLQRSRTLTSDTALGILAHSTLSLGVVALAFAEGLRVDLMAYLFGDILAITAQDLWWVFGGGALALFILLWLWRPLLAVTVHEELARVEGVPVKTVSIGLMLLVALVVAVAMKIVGILLITSLLIIPAAAARRIASTPEQMAAYAVVIGCFAVAGGLLGSLRWDTPAGPSIVVAAAMIFALVYLFPWVRSQEPAV